MEDLSMHIMDIMQNSIDAGCEQIRLTVGLTKNDEYLDISVEDDGCGMNEEIRKKAMDPFYTSRDTRDVGLGISLFKAAVETTGGTLRLSSEEGRGTLIQGLFKNQSIDRQPLGNVGNVLFLNMLSYPDIRFLVDIYRQDTHCTFDSLALIQEKEEEGHSSMDAAFEAEKLVNRRIKDVFQDALPEIGGNIHAAK